MSGTATLWLALACTWISGAERAEREDIDGDGYEGLIDCDDRDPDAWAWQDAYVDGDGDGYGAGEQVEVCGDAPSGYATVGTDCDDENAAIHPGADEICDDADSDCDGLGDAEDPDSDWRSLYADADGDGYGDADADPVETCENLPGYTPENNDCDDDDADTHPDQADEACDGIDQDCDDAIDEDAVTTTQYLDLDGDAYGTSDSELEQCEGVGGYVAVGGDCDDADDSVHPGALEICGDDVDDDCNDELASCALETVATTDGALASVSAPGFATLGLALIGDADFDGDGAADLAMGAPNRAYDGTTGAGSVAVTGASLEIESLEEATVVFSGHASISLGYAVAWLTDEDGMAALAISSDGKDVADDTVWVVPTGTTTHRTIDEAADASFVADDASRFGSFLVEGDFDDDGVADLLVGAPGDRRSHVFHGPFTGQVEADDDDSSFTGTLTTETAFVDDLDGDGVDDVVLGAPTAEGGRGHIQLFLGPLDTGVLDLGSGDATGVGDLDGSAYGEALSAGDTDGDGHPELVVGAPGASYEASQGGSIVVWQGRAKWEARELAMVNSGFYVDHDVDDALFGYELTAAGDLNGDGLAELAVAAPQEGDGVVYTFLGPLEGIGGAADYLVDDAAFTRTAGQDASGYFGLGLAWAGDPEHLGYDHLVVSAPYASSDDALYVGTTYLLPGGPE